MRMLRGTPTHSLRPIARLAVVWAGGVIAGSCSAPEVGTTGSPELSELEVVARYSIPRIEGDTARLAITALAVGNDGTVHLATDDGYLHRFSSLGGLESSARTEKERPTENRVVRALLIHSSGMLVARDAGGEVRFLDSKGATVTSWAGGPSGGLQGSQLLAEGPDGSLAVGVAGISETEEGDGARPLLVHFDTDGTRLDTVRAPAELLGACRDGPDNHFRSGTFDDFRIRYLPSLQWTPLPDGGVVVGCNGAYRLKVIARKGKSVEISRESSGVPVSTAEKESFVSAWTLRMSASGAGAGWRWMGDTIPDLKPAYHRILSGTDGGVWVWPSRPSVVVPAPPQWVLIGGPEELWVEPAGGAFDRFAPDGSYLGTASLPPGMGYVPFGISATPVVRGDTLWMVESDSLGISSVVRLQARAPRWEGLRDSRRSGETLRDPSRRDAVRVRYGRAATALPATVILSVPSDATDERPRDPQGRPAHLSFKPIAAVNDV